MKDRQHRCTCPLPETAVRRVCADGCDPGRLFPEPPGPNGRSSRFDAEKAQSYGRFEPSSLRGSRR